MTEQELLEKINGGESSVVQFKERLSHHDSLAHEIIAFSNSKGGTIIFGVNDKTGALNGLSFGEIQQVNQQIVNIASQKVYPPVYLTTETVTVDNNRLLVVNIEEGLSKLYKDSNGTIYAKNGSDKRKVTSNDEIARLLGSKSLLRVEIVSPGKLPNSLTVEEVKYGNPVIRNNQIALFASRTIPYSGLGSGLRRAFANQPDMELENDIDGEQFMVRFPRKVME